MNGVYLASNNILTDTKFTMKEILFIHSYLACGNSTQACREAGYKCKTDLAMSKQGSALLAKPEIKRELEAQLQAQVDKKTAKKDEIFQFYTSVMRGEILDQFGIEASLDTRIKAANELAKYQIELPMKLEQKNITNNIGSITLNFMPRQESNPEISSHFTEVEE